MFTLKLSERKSSRCEDIYEVDIEGQKSNLEVVVISKERFFQEKPKNKEIEKEEEQYKVETLLSSQLWAIWHTPQQVVEYFLEYRKGKTAKDLVTNLKTDLDSNHQQSEKQHQTIIDMDGSIESAQASLSKAEGIVIEIKGIGQEREDESFLKRNDIEITENDLKLIFSEYFRGTDLENINYQWSEIINLPDYAWCATKLFQWETLEWAERGEVLVQLALKLKTSYNSADDTRKKIFARLMKENEIKKWIIDRGVNYNQLKEAFKENPRRVIHYYKLDKNEEIFWFGEITEIFNAKFGTNKSPVQVFSFFIGGLLGLVWLGYWFVSRIKALIRNRNNNGQLRTHRD